eukprot:GGOE01061894.1.p1 GENE.GGOE01061894.1~~GGOE01061894.1.p1  ORF type:complete len:477 (-),score=154.30 GGOE01061894.1:191-1537(-)
MAEPKGMLETRLRSVETLCSRFNDQLQAMKKLFESKISTMQHDVDAQLADIKQVIMQQDRTYRERIRRLEARIEQLSEFAVRLARTKACAAVVGGVGLVEGLARPPAVLPAEMKDEPTLSSPQKGTAKWASPNSTPKARRPSRPPDQPAGDSVLSVTEVIGKHLEKIEEVFSTYTALRASSDTLRRTMDQDAFSKLVKDAGLSSVTAASTELLWMNVIRKVSPDAHVANEVKTGWELRGDQFCTALQVLAADTYGKRYPDIAAGAQLEALLTQAILPACYARRSSVSSTDLAQDFNVAAVLSRYNTEAIAKLLQRRRPLLQDKFAQYVSRQTGKAKGLTFSSLLDLTKDHDILPFTNKPTLRLIVNQCLDTANREKPLSDPLLMSPGSDGGRGLLTRHNSAREPILPFDTFQDVLKGIAEVVYGGDHCAAAYPTPESRLQKVLAKLSC